MIVVIDTDPLGMLSQHAAHIGHQRKIVQGALGSLGCFAVRVSFTQHPFPNIPVEGFGSCGGGARDEARRIQLRRLRLPPYLDALVKPKRLHPKLPTANPKSKL